MFKTVTGTSGSKTIDSKLADKKYSLHLERLNRIKRSSSQTLQLQNNNSEIIKNASYLRNNDKKKELQREIKNIKIDHDNKILLNKMTQIVNNTSLKNTFYNFQNVQSTSGNKPKSMNHHLRKQEIEKVVAENIGIVERIQRKTSFYDIRKWEKDFKTRDSYIKNLCEFPHSDSSHFSHDKTPSSISPMRGSLSPVKKHRLDDKVKLILHRRSHSSDMSSRVKNIQSSKRLILYKRELDINDALHLVEFAVFEKKFYITLSCSHNQEVKSIELEDEKGKQLLIENNNSYDKIISKIYVKNEKLFIKGFHEEDALNMEAKIELFNSLTNRRFSG